MNKKKSVLNALFLIVIFIATLYYIFHDKDLNKLGDYLELSDTRYWIVAVLFVIMFIFGESVILCYLFQSVGQKVKFRNCCLYSFIGFFFSSITPSASGGQPMQIVYMKKDGIPVSVSSIMLMMVTIGYKLVLVILGGAVMIFRPSGIVSCLEPVWGWFALGIILNVIVVGFMLFLVFYTRLAESFMRGILKLGRGLMLFKNKERWEKRIANTIKRYDETSRYLRQHPQIAVNVVLLSIVQRFFLFAITAVVYVSFGLHSKSLIDITVLQGMLSVAVDMLPTPGGMGFSEGLFLVVFEPFFGKLTLSGMVVSRGISFYSQLLICMVMTIFAHFRLKKNGKG